MCSCRPAQVYKPNWNAKEKGISKLENLVVTLIFLFEETSSRFEV